MSRDGYGRLLSYVRSSDPAQANAYNGLDERVGATSGSVTHSFVYDPDGRLMGEYDSSGSPVAETIWLSPAVAGGNQPLGGDDGVGGYAPLAVATGSGSTSALYWVHGNHLGVPIVTTDASGAAATPPAYTMAGFPGQTHSLSDIYYNRYRDYDSSLGRYIQADPIGLGGGANDYAYALDNPLRYTDPSGRIVPLALCGIGAVTGGIGTAIGSYLTQRRVAIQDVVAGAAVGCVAGVAAPVVATTWIGTAALGALANVTQGILSRKLKGCPTTGSDVLWDAAWGIGGGILGGRFAPRRGLNYAGNRAVGGAIQGAARGVAAGASTTYVSGKARQ